MNDLKPLLESLEIEALFISSPYATTVATNKRADLLIERYRGILQRVQAFSDSGLTQKSEEVPFEIPKGREYREVRVSENECLIFKLILDAEGSKLIAVNPSVSYRELQQRDETISVATELSPQPISLIRLDPNSGKSEGVFATSSYCETYGMSKAVFEEHGIPALTARALPEDRKLCDIYVPACVRLMRENVQVMRVLTKAGIYRWYRQSSMVTLGPEGKIFGTCLVDDFDDTAHVILKSLTENRSAMMLMSMGQTVFDFCACLDRKMRVLILSDNAKHWLLTDPGKQAAGAPFETFISLDHHKLNFRTFLESRLKEPHTMVGASPCKIRMNLVGNRLVEVSVLVMPLQSKDLVLCHSLSAPGASGISSLAAKLLLPAEIETCFYMGCTLVDRSVLKKSTRRKQRGTSSSSEQRDNGNQQVTESSPASSHQGWSVVFSLFWVLMRDLHYSLSLVRSPDAHKWWTPLYRVSYPELEKEELVRLLPNNLQSEFMEAADRADFNTCSQLLSYSVEGNANILSPGMSRAGQLVSSRDLIRCAFRFFLSLVPLLGKQPARQFALLSEIDDSRKLFISRRLDQTENILLLYHFCLVLISTAHQSREYFSTDRCVQWLRSTFSEVLTAPEIEHIHPGSKLATAYWTCILWGSLMHAMGRDEEALATLTQTVNDMDIYCVQHPFVPSVRELQCLALQNLYISASQNSDYDLRKTLKKQLGAALSHARSAGARVHIRI